MDSTSIDELTKEELVALLRAQTTEAYSAGAEERCHDLELQLAELEMRHRLLLDQQQELELRARRYAELYDFAPVAIATVDRELKIEDVNLTAGAFLRGTRETLIGRPLSGLVVPEERALVRGHLKRCMADKVRVTSEVRLLSDGHGPMPFQLVSTVLFDRDQQVIGCKCALTDVSALKRSEERQRVLARASAQFSSSFDVSENLAQVVRMLVPELADLAFADIVDEQDRVTRVEVACADPAKRALGEALKRPPTPAIELIEPLVLTSAARAAFAMAIEDGPERTALTEAFDPHAIMMVPVTARERRLGAIGFVMTESKRSFSSADVAFASDLAARVAMAIDNARLFDDARRAVRAREDVLSVVSHDLKTPLAGIRLNADLMVKSAPPGERRKGRVQLDRIKAATAQMERLIDDLLDLSSIDLGRLSVVQRDQSLAKLIRDAVEMLAPLAQDHGVRLEAPMLPEPVWVGCDGGRVLQVFSNLIGNAIKFCPPGAVIEVTASPVDGKARVCVRDTGPGMPPAVLRNLFQRFWQAKETAAKGRGLGLYISKGIIESLGGEIWVESQAGKGTQVSFTLPLVPVPRLPVVLVVDDDEGLRETVGDLLTGHGYAVVKAADGREALSYLQSDGERPELVLLDLGLPELDGRELLKLMKSDASLAKIPVVLVSSAEQLEEEALRLGAAGSIKKPVDVETLLTTVDDRPGAHGRVTGSTAAAEK